eukprot:SAG22_NODE_1875_length_3388_cov_17.483223_1_plen_399_part_00
MLLGNRGTAKSENTDRQVYDYAAKDVRTVFFDKPISQQASADWIVAAGGGGQTADLSKPTAAMVKTEKGVITEVVLYPRPLRLPGEDSAGSKSGPSAPTLALQQWAQQFDAPGYAYEQARGSSSGCGAGVAKAEEEKEEKEEEEEEELSTCEKCLANMMDYCIKGDHCVERGSFKCKGPSDHVTSDPEFKTADGNDHQSTCPISKEKAKALNLAKEAAAKGADGGGDKDGGAKEDTLAFAEQEGSPNFASITVQGAVYTHEKVVDMRLSKIQVRHSHCDRPPGSPAPSLVLSQPPPRFSILKPRCLSELECACLLRAGFADETRSLACRHQQGSAGRPHGSLQAPAAARRLARRAVGSLLAGFKLRNNGNDCHPCKYTLPLLDTVMSSVRTIPSALTD